MHDVTSPRRPSRPRWVLAPALALTLLLGATGCSGGGSGSDSSSGSEVAQDAGGGSVAGGDAAGTSQQAVAGAADGAAPTEVDAAASSRAVVSTATLAVRVEDLTAASAAVERLTLAAGGLVTASQGGSSGEDQQAHLTLRVPSPGFDATLDGVAALGQQTDRSTTSTDVTAEVADVDSRVASAQAVLVTFRDRLPQASTIPDILAIEGEIARRQADLEALQARQRVLADQVALATIDVALTQGGPASTAAASQPGFTGGVSAGWHALGEVLRVASLALGAVLPFLVPAAVVAVPVLLLRRRRARSTAPAEPSAPTP